MWEIFLQGYILSTSGAAFRLCQKMLFLLRSRNSNHGVVENFVFHPCALHFLWIYTSVVLKWVSYRVRKKVKGNNKQCLLLHSMVLRGKWKLLCLQLRPSKQKLFWTCKSWGLMFRKFRWLSQLHLQNLGTVWTKHTGDKKNCGERSCTKKENTKTIEREKL